MTLISTMVFVAMATTTAVEQALPAQTTVTFTADRVEVVEPDGRTSLVSPPCAVTAATPLADRVLLACSGSGIAILERTEGGDFRLGAVLATDGEVAGFHVVDQRIWVELRRLEARPLDSFGTRGAVSAPAPAPAPAPAAAVPAGPQAAEAPSAAVAEGEVVEQQADGVVVDLGTAHGLDAGDRVELFVRQEVPLPGGETAIEESRVAVGKVRTASAGYARVALGLNEQVEMGTLARPTDAEITASRYLPRRPRGLLSGAITLRPFLALGEFGFGTVSDLIVAYRFYEPLRVQLVLEPLGLGVADAGNIVATAGNVFVSYDEEVFEVGLGAGWSAVNNDLGSFSDDERVAAGPDGITAEFDNVQYGFSLAQIARLGPEDGLHLLVRNTFVLYQDEFHYGGTVGQAMVPVGKRSAIFGRGGGGQAGFGFGELGLRLLLFGNGLHDSLFVSASLGGAGLFGERKVRMDRCVNYEGEVYLAGERCYESIDYWGPMVGLGFEYRP